MDKKLQTENTLVSKTANETAVSKCDRCGAELVFDAKKQKLSCPHCNNVVEFKIDNAEELKFEANLDKNTWLLETDVWRCPSCGAKQVVAKKDIAKSCPFCGRTNIVKSKENENITKPNGVLPFQIDKFAAADLALNYAKKKVYAPGFFKKHVSPEEICAMYCPAYTFDADTESVYSGRLGKHYTTTHRDSNGRTHVRVHTRYFNISGGYNKSFDDVLVQASAIIDGKIAKKIKGFDTNTSKKYDEKFLYGSSAEYATKTGNNCYAEAKSFIDKSIYSGILSKYSYDVVVSLDIKSNFSNIKYKQVLLPLYLGKYYYKDKIYNFYVNGENGTVFGHYPKSGWKIFWTIFGVCALIGAGYLVYRLLGGE
ncbi:MAG: hypothetical protein LBH47_03265 [Christensenellaceae bacterium]|jgi:predicted RNA-binding Zn-ribbon protein involved in translation (DUF1610 family)|nr:hypothetical protein [Christensenellaceae bacterium]